MIDYSKPANRDTCDECKGRCSVHAFNKGDVSNIVLEGGMYMHSFYTPPFWKKTVGTEPLKVARQILKMIWSIEHFLINVKIYVVCFGFALPCTPNG